MTPRIADIQAIVAQHYGLSVEEIRGTERKQRIVRARHVAMYLARRMTIKSSNQVGIAFGGRDHSTVLSAVARIHGLRARDSELDDDVRTVARLAATGGSAQA